MSQNLSCPKCSARYSIEEILSGCGVSWPELNWAYFKCSTCKQSTHILLKKDKVATVNFIGAPGPDWKINESVSVPNLEVRVDPGFLHVWYKSQHYEYQAKT